MKLQGKTAIVTGSTSGMGVDEAKLLVSEGANVVVVGRRAPEGERVVDDIRAAGGNALFVQTDMTDPESIAGLVAKTIEEYGRIDILVNNAGVFDKYATLLDTDEDLWDLIYETNVKSIYRISRIVVAHMLEHGGGSIVNIASIAGLVAGKGGAAYTTSKHAVIGLTKHMASEYAKSGIRVNAICPGTIVTPLIAEVVDDIPKDNVPMRRFGEPIEVAQLCLLLASDEAQFVNGAIIPIDGGYTIQ